MQSSKVSVLMSVYNERDEWLRMSIESILDQTYTDFEFIIVNDNPTDERIRHILSGYAEKDSRIRIVENECNKGLVYSLNHGLKYAQGEYVARMDADEFAHADRLSTQLGFIQQGNYDITSAVIDFMDEESCVFKKGDNTWLDDLESKKMLKYINCIPHSSWLIKAEAYKQLNGYRYINAAEDYDFLLRAAVSGLHIGLYGNALQDSRIRIQGISKQNALRQFIVSCYMVDNMDRLSDISPEDIEEYVSSRLNEKDITAYEKVVENKHPSRKANVFRKAAHVLYSLLISKYAYRYFSNALHVRHIKKKCRRQAEK